MSYATSARSWIVRLTASFQGRRPFSSPSAARPDFIPTLEGLEERVVPYAVTGYQWANTAVSASFMPDGTATDNLASSNLFAKLNASFTTETWQREFARALQTWAAVSPLNFHLVADDGTASGAAGSAQGDSRFGDIRFGAYARADNYVGYTYYPAGTTKGGDVFLNSNTTFRIGTNLDLYSTLVHEIGHGLGLGHASQSGAVMYSTIMGVYSSLSSDDIAGIQAIYGTRQADAYDAAATNNTLATATTLSLNGSDAVTVNGDLTTVADVDYYRVTASSNGSLTVTLDARGLSLLTPKVAVYDAAGNLLGSADAGTAYGTMATVTVNGLAAGESYFVMADGATNDVFGMSAYQLDVQFVAGSVPPPATSQDPMPTLTIGQASLAEGNSGSTIFQYHVTLSAASNQSVIVQYTTTNGTALSGNDYQATSGTLTFAAGEMQKTIEVSVIGDTLTESNETFFVNLSSATNATLGIDQGQGTIQNDDVTATVTADRYESNNSFTAAKNLGKTTTISKSGLTLHTATDVDYYYFTPSKSGTYRITVTPTQGTGTINVTGMNPQQVVLASGQSETSGVTLTVNLTSGKRHYIKVASSTGDSFTYSLAVAKSTTTGGGATAHEDELGHGTASSFFSTDHGVDVGGRTEANDVSPIAAFADKHDVQLFFGSSRGIEKEPLEATHTQAAEALLQALLADRESPRLFQTNEKDSEVPTDALLAVLAEVF